MKIILEDYLHQIDTVLNTKEKKEIYMIYIMVIAAIFSFSYYLFWENAKYSLENKTRQIIAMKSTIDQNKNYLNHNTNNNIAKIEESIQNYKKEYIRYQDNNKFINEKLQIISSYIYNKDTWGEYLDSISKNAQMYNIKILNYSNKYATSNQKFGHVLDIDIISTGNYTNTLMFINSLETNSLVVDLNDINITMNENLNTHLKISVWGVSNQ